MAAPAGRSREALIQRLQDRREALERQSQRVQADRRRAAGALDPDLDEQAIELENDEVLDALDEVERAELVAIRAALGRIETGRFGVCDACAEEIDRRRLEVLPAAALCVDCAREREGSPASRT